MRATRISSWVNLTVSGKPSEGQRINCWIRAPPLGGGDHVTSDGLTGLYGRVSGRSLLPVVLAIGHLYLLSSSLYCFISASIILHLLHPSRSITLDAPDTKLSNIH